MDFGHGMDKQIISGFFHKLAHTFEKVVLRYTSFSDGSCEFFIPANEANTNLLVDLIKEYFGQLDAKSTLDNIRIGEHPSLPVIFTDHEANLCTFFIIEGNAEFYRISIKLLPLDVIDSIASVTEEAEDDFEFIPAYDKNITWH